jgi:hypothetical protein
MRGPEKALQIERLQFSDRRLPGGSRFNSIPSSGHCSSLLLPLCEPNAVSDKPNRRRQFQEKLFQSVTRERACFDMLLVGPVTFGPRWIRGNVYQACTSDAPGGDRRAWFNLPGARLILPTSALGSNPNPGNPFWHSTPIKSVTRLLTLLALGLVQTKSGWGGAGDRPPKCARGGLWPSAAAFKPSRWEVARPSPRQAAAQALASASVHWMSLRRGKPHRVARPCGLLGYQHHGFFAACEEFSDYAAFAMSWSGLALRQANNA